MENHYVPIKGRQGLVKDPATGAIINKDKKAYQEALSRHEQAQKQENRIKSLENELNEVKNGISQILSILSNK